MADDIFEESREELERLIRRKERTEKWRTNMEAKYGGPEGVREHFREMKRRSQDHPHNQPGQHRGGFSNRKVASKAGKRSKRGKAVNKRKSNGTKVA